MAKRATRPAAQSTVDHSLILKEVSDNAVIVLTDPVKLDQYLAALRAEVDANPGDTATASGRDIIRSNASGIGKKKSAIEKVRLAKTEEWRSLTAAVNAAGKVVKERFQALQDEVRAPLTAWEEREDARKSEAQAIIDDMLASSVVRIDDTSASIQERLDRIRGRNLSDEMFGPRIMEVTDLRDSTVATLQVALERVAQAEKDAADLARMRAEEDQRIADEAARRAREEADAAAAAKARQDAEAEEQRKADEAARLQREREEAADLAKRAAEEAAAQAIRDAEDKARREKEEADAKAAAEIAEANARALKARQEAAANRTIAIIRECAMGALNGRKEPWAVIVTHLEDSVDVCVDTLGDHVSEVSRLRNAALEHARSAQAEEAEAERKKRDQAHRASINNAAKTAIMTCGVEEDTAKKVVLAIAGGAIPHISISYVGEA